MPLMILWALASVFALSAAAASAIRLRIRRRSWRPEIVNGIPVHTSHDVGPAVFGILTYSIVVPGWVAALDPQQRQLILAHEREHVRAADPALLSLGVLMIVIMPWNAGVWYIVRRLRMATEIDCDQRVLDLIPEPRAYAELLLDVGERSLNAAIPIAALGERPSLLRERIETMTSQQPQSPRMKSAIAATAAGLVFIVACQTPRPYSTSTPSERIPELASELTALMRNDSAMQALSPADRAKVRSDLRDALSDTDRSFIPTGAQLKSLVQFYYPEIAASPPGAGTLLAFVFDERDSVVHRTQVPLIGNERMEAVKRIGELFPDVRDRKVWASGIARIRFEEKPMPGHGPIMFIWESFRDPNGAFAKHHRVWVPEGLDRRLLNVGRAP